MRYSVYAALLMAAAVIAAPSCLREDEMAQKVTVSFDITAMESRSGGYSDAVSVTDANIYAYKDGMLYSSVWTGDGARPELSLNSGDSYDFLVIGDLGCDFQPALHQADMENIAIHYSGSGIPMSTIIRGITARQGLTVQVGLERLYSRFGITIDRSRLKETSYTIKSARIRQAADAISPFKRGYAVVSSSQTKDGDTASATDISVLNSSSGGPVWLYAPENCQGNLLPGNENQRWKIPEKIGAKAGVCTWLEVSASYSSPGVSCQDVTFRIYLGKDNCSNFDIERNTSSIIEIQLQDDTVYGLYWKVSADNLTDSRVLRFSRKYVSLNSYDNDSETITFDVYPSDLKYTLEWDSSRMEESGIGISVSGRTISLNCENAPEYASSATISLRSWDGRITDICTIGNEGENGSDYRYEWLSGDNGFYIGQKNSFQIVDDCDMVLGGLEISSDYGLVEVSSQGSTYYVSGISEGIDYLSFNYKGDTWTEEVTVYSPLLKFSSDKIILPIDGEQVDIGPHYYCYDGVTRLERGAGFDAELYDRLLAISISRSATDAIGEDLFEVPAGAQQLCPYINLTDDGEYGCPEISMYLSSLSAPIGTMEDTYYDYPDIHSSGLLLERITAHSPSCQSTAAIYTVDPFPASQSLGNFDSWAPAMWQSPSWIYENGGTRNESFTFNFSNAFKSNVRKQYASVIPASGLQGMMNSEVDMEDGSMTITFLYDSYGDACMPPATLSMRPSVINRHSGDRFTSWKTYTANFSVHMAIGGVLTDFSSAGAAVSASWACRHTISDYGTLDAMIAGSDMSGSDIKGLGTNLYRVGSDAVSGGNSADPNWMDSNTPEITICDLSSSGISEPEFTLPNGETYEFYLVENSYVPQRLKVHRYIDLYPQSNGWVGHSTDL